MLIEKQVVRSSVQDHWSLVPIPANTSCLLHTNISKYFTSVVVFFLHLLLWHHLTALKHTLTHRCLRFSNVLLLSDLNLKYGASGAALEEEGTWEKISVCMTHNWEQSKKCWKRHLWWIAGLIHKCTFYVNTIFHSFFPPKYELLFFCSFFETCFRLIVPFIICLFYDGGLSLGCPLCGAVLLCMCSGRLEGMTTSSWQKPSAALNRCSWCFHGLCKHFNERHSLAPASADLWPPHGGTLRSLASLRT